MRERTKSLLQWIRSEIKFLLLIVIIIAAAMLSFSYAYLRSKDSSPTAETATEMQARQFDTFDTAQPEPEAGPEPAAASPSQDTPPTTPKPKSNDSSNIPGGTLGAEVNCVKVNADAGWRVTALERQLRDLPALNIGSLYNDIRQAYDSYKNEVTLKGCTPTLKLPELPKSPL